MKIGQILESDQAAQGFCPGKNEIFPRMEIPQNLSAILLSAWFLSEREFFLVPCQNFWGCSLHLLPHVMSLCISWKSVSVSSHTPIRERYMTTYNAAQRALVLCCCKGGFAKSCSTCYPPGHPGPFLNFWFSACKRKWCNFDLKFR